MKWLFIICLTLNGITQGNNIDDLTIKIKSLEYERTTMKTKIRELEEDLTILEKRKK